MPEVDILERVMIAAVRKEHPNGDRTYSIHFEDADITQEASIEIPLKDAALFAAELEALAAVIKADLIRPFGLGISAGD